MPEVTGSILGGEWEVFFFLLVEIFFFFFIG